MTNNVANLWHNISLTPEGVIDNKSIIKRNEMEKNDFVSIVYEDTRIATQHACCENNY
jgi:hypothetical protein